MLGYLYRRNAELCSEMAAKTQSVEVREQWLELAKGWVAKAESEERTIAAGRHHPPVQQITPAKSTDPEIESVPESEECTVVPVRPRPLVEPITPFKLVLPEVERVQASERHTAAPRPAVKLTALPKPLVPKIEIPQGGISFAPEEPKPTPMATQEPSPEAPLQPQKQDVDPLDETWAALMADIRGR
jgi:hypothetical protein